MVTCDLGMGVGSSCFLQKFDSPYIDYQVSRNSTRKDKKKYYKSFTSIISNIYRARDGDCISFIIQKQNQYFHVFLSNPASVIHFSGDIRRKTLLLHIKQLKKSQTWSLSPNITIHSFMLFQTFKTSNIYLKLSSLYATMNINISILISNHTADLLKLKLKLSFQKDLRDPKNILCQLINFGLI